MTEAALRARLDRAEADLAALRARHREVSLRLAQALHALVLAEARGVVSRENDPLAKPLDAGLEMSLNCYTCENA